MTIQYRCRCGQEVILRPREGLYIAAGFALGLGLLNTVLLAYLVATARTAPPPGSPASGSPAVEAPDSASEAPLRIDPMNRTADTREPTSRIPESSSIDRTPAPPPEVSTARAATEIAPTAEATEPAPSAGAGLPEERSGDPDTTGESEASPASFRGESAPDRLSAGREDRPSAHVLPAPTFDAPSFSGFRTWALLSSPVADPLDRAAAWIAISCNGPEVWKRVAVERLTGDPATRDFAPLLGSAGGAWVPSRSGLELVPGEVDPQVAPVLERWRAWNDGSGTPALGNEALRWVQAAEAVARPPRAHVILVDLTQSMEAEVRDAADHLRIIVPVLTGRAPATQWGWVAYRDEVVDRQPLTSDPDPFLDSLARWQCDAGGDVPEGVDRALFEVFRFGAFEWAPNSERILTILGDAPPVYDRIAGMLSLAEAAHASPDAYRIQTLGVAREAAHDRVPSFDDLARAGGGRSVVVAESTSLASALWSLLAGLEPPPWP